MTEKFSVREPPAPPVRLMAQRRRPKLKRAAARNRLVALEEARALEAAGGNWTIRQATAVLGIHRATLYRTPGLLRRAEHVTGKLGGAVRFSPREIRLWQALHQGP
jgi:predicted DNA-binding transcriptional regulator AlpA